MPYEVKFTNTTHCDKQTAVIPNATSRNDGVMSKEQVVALAVASAPCSIAYTQMTEIGYQNGWQDFESAFAPGAYTKDPCGFVHLRGAIRGGTLNDVAFTLPAGYRPGAPNAIFRVASVTSLGPINVRIDSNGNINILTDTGNNGLVGFDGITFLAEG